jgi:hypothetical protein
MVQASEKPGNFILVRFIACRDLAAMNPSRPYAMTVKTTGYHRITGLIRDRVIRLLLWLGWAEEFYDHAYGGHGGIWEEGGVEFRGRKIKEGGYTPRA